jgi:hypothetical protein
MSTTVLRTRRSSCRWRLLHVLLDFVPSEAAGRCARELGTRVVAASAELVADDPARHRADDGARHPVLILDRLVASRPRRGTSRGVSTCSTSGVTPTTSANSSSASIR